jgi:hypothetical protein
MDLSFALEHGTIFNAQNNQKKLNSKHKDGIESDQSEAGEGQRGRSGLSPPRDCVEENDKGGGVVARDVLSVIL